MFGPFNGGFFHAKGATAVPVQPFGFVGNMVGQVPLVVRPMVQAPATKEQMKAAEGRRHGPKPGGGRY